jgi:hypothetical protein
MTEGTSHPFVVFLDPDGVNDRTCAESKNAKTARTGSSSPLCAEAKSDVPLVAPVEASLSVTEKHFRRFKESEAREDLARVEQVNGDGVFGH